jgi:hypothetical protein
MVSVMKRPAIIKQAEINQLVDEYRQRCLWFLGEHFYPETREDIVKTMDYICRYGDSAAFRKATEIKSWVLQNIKKQSAN